MSVRPSTCNRISAPRLKSLIHPHNVKRWRKTQNRSQSQFGTGMAESGRGLICSNIPEFAKKNSSQDRWYPSRDSILLSTEHRRYRLAKQRNWCKRLRSELCHIFPLRSIYVRPKFNDTALLVFTMRYAQTQTGKTPYMFTPSLQTFNPATAATHTTNRHLQSCNHVN